MADLQDREIVVIPLRNKESLTPFIFDPTSTFKEFKTMVNKVTRLDKGRLKYVDEEGDAVCLDSEDEFIEAMKQANKTKQLHLIVDDRGHTAGKEREGEGTAHHHTHHHAHPHHSHPHHSHKRHYHQLATAIGDKKRRAAEYAARKLLSEGGRHSEEDKEPEWFRKAMKNYVKEILNGVNATVPPLPLAKEEESMKTIHESIICDHCQRGIIGVRYKCGNCSDYDLCEDCEKFSEYLHRNDHVFLKIKSPARFAGITKKGKRKPLIKHSVFSVPNYQKHSPSVVVMVEDKEDEEEEEQEDVPIEKEELSIPPLIISTQPSAPPQQEVEEEEEEVYSGERKTEIALLRRSKKQLRKDLKKSSREDPIHINGQGDLVRYSKKQLRELKAANKQKKCKREVAPVPSCKSPQPLIVDTLLLSSSCEGTTNKGHGKCLDAQFITDTSFPDGSVITCGKAFTKGWIVQNVGTKKWQKVQLVHQNGFRPIQPEVDVPDLAPGEQAELIVNYPAVSPDDGLIIKGSWRLIHNKTTPFGCSMWLSCTSQLDPVDELSVTFEHISYPSLKEEKEEEEVNEEEEQEEEEQEEEEQEEEEEEEEDRKSESGFSYVDVPTPTVLSCQSSLVETGDDNEEKEDDVCSDDEFVVIIPDCFKLDKPLHGYAQEKSISPPPSLLPSSLPPSLPPSLPSSLPPSTQEEILVVSPPQCEEDSEEEEEEEIQEKEVKNEVSPSAPLPPSPPSNKKPFVPERTTISRAWDARSRKPFNYAIGLINTVTDVVDKHVHVAPTVPKTPPTRDPIMPLQMSPLESLTPPTLTTPQMTPPTTEQDVTQFVKEKDVSRFINQKWEEPKPSTPMEQLIGMGFANRALNSRLLKKHNNVLPKVVEELVETQGEGFQDSPIDDMCTFS